MSTLKSLFQRWYNPPKLMKMRATSMIVSFVMKNLQISSTNQTSKRCLLSPTELNEGCLIGLDSWADTSCMGKHAFVRDFVEGKIVSASGFSSNLQTLNNIPIANCSLAYDSQKEKHIY